MKPKKTMEPYGKMRVIKFKDVKINELVFKDEKIKEVVFEEGFIDNNNKKQPYAI